MSYKLETGKSQMVVRNSDGKVVALPSCDNTPDPFTNLVLFARAVAQCQMDITGISLVICMARFGPSGIARMNAANMFSALTHPHHSGAIATAVRHNERDSNLWKAEQTAKEIWDAKARANRIVTVRNLKGKVKHYEIEMVTPAFKLVETPIGPRTWGIEERKILKFKTKKDALRHVA